MMVFLQIWIKLQITNLNRLDKFESLIRLNKIILERFFYSQGKRQSVAGKI